jgi:hypothetical protein
MTDVTSEGREFGMHGNPGTDEVPGGGMAASGEVTMKKVPRFTEDGDTETDGQPDEEAE